MRTTLAIDDDVMLAAKALADCRQQSVGTVISDLVRQSLQAVRSKSAAPHGLPVYDRKDHSVVITLDLVNALRDEGE